MINVNLTWLKKTLELDHENIINLTSELSQTDITGVSTDSRTIDKGQVFVALKGPNFDGNKFVEQVQEKGAIAVVVDQKLAIDIPQFIVPDTLKAYGKIAAQVAKESNLKTIAITGSVGKTSVKEMSFAILSRKGKVLATEGNFNNEIGVPHTLMRFSPDYDYAVVELGANHIGEIAYTTELVKPDVAILNNVGEAHLEGFGDIFGVVRAKGEIFNGLSDKGIAIVNGLSEYKQSWITRLNEKFTHPEHNIIQFYAEDKGCADSDIVAKEIVLDELGCAQFNLHYKNEKVGIHLPIPGIHNVANALAAAAGCLAIGVTMDDVKLGLASMPAVKGRVNLQPVNDQLLVIDDTYNANVRSVNAASDLLSNYQGMNILVLGDMAELGSEGRRYHQDVGEYALAQNITNLFSVGVLSQCASSVFAERGQHFSQNEDAIGKLKELIDNTNNKVNVLVKGSRSAKMEQVVDALVTHYQNKKNNKG